MNSVNKRLADILFFLVVFLISVQSFGAEKDVEKFLDQLPVKQKTTVYKTAGDAELKLHIFEPENRKTNNPLPAIVFFFGGGWTGGTPKQFYPHCKYLASRGMVAISAEYRVKSRHGTTPVECVKDGKSAVRWIRENAKKLGIDSEKIAAGGGSAGGHVAACTAVITGFEEETENRKISSVPNALVLFNPVTDVTPARWEERMKDFAKDISPNYHIRKGLPPAIIFHGTADTLVPFEQVVRFRDLMKKAGNICKLVPYDDMEHGFFNFGRHENKPFESTVREMDRFLSSLGFLKGSPSL